MAATPLSPASPEEAPPLPVVREPDSKARVMSGSVGGVPVYDAGLAGSAGLEMGLGEELEPPRPWEKPKENQRGDTPNEVSERKPKLYYYKEYIQKKNNLPNKY